jgi:hypothetical protein
MRASAAFAIAIIAGLASPALADEAGLTPKQIGETFCLSRLSGDTGPILGLLTPGLAADLATAEEKNAAWEKANPGEKPPLGDGTPWASFFDYAAKCEVGAVTTKPTHADIEIKYGFPEAPEADYSDWLSLEKVDVPALYAKAWRIDNVAYVEDGNLRALLKDMFAPE